MPRRESLFQPIENASLVFYRVYFGLLVAWSLARFWLNGWLERSFVEPRVFFPYWGFEWVQVPSAAGVYALFAIGIVSGLFVAAGFLYRFSSLSLFLSFTYIELMDQSNYLNHYYLVSLLAFLNLFLPLNGDFSLDARWGIAPRSKTAPAWCLWLLRFQVAVVYFFAGLAKLGPDWLLHAQPMNGWMMAQGDLPLIGPWLMQPWVQYAMAWSGFLFDLTIWAWMLIPAARPFAYAAIIVFHVFTSLFFPIGLFPLIMIGMATVFFSPGWPRLAPAAASGPAPDSRQRTWVLAGLGLWVVFQLAMPLRHFLYPGNLLWTEEGMRFSWKVMVREKNGQVTYTAVDRSSGRTWEISASQYLVEHQELELSGQPDMILSLAHVIQKDFAAKGIVVAVYAEAWVSLNNRPAAPMIDSRVDLTQVQEGWSPKTWILPAPTEAPRRLRNVALQTQDSHSEDSP